MKRKERKNTEKLTEGWVQKAMKKAKEDWIHNQCNEIDACLNKNNS